MIDFDAPFLRNSIEIIDGNYRFHVINYLLARMEA